MSNQPFIMALNAINPAHLLGAGSHELPLSLVSAYFLQLRALLDYEHYPALIVDAGSGDILSINLPAFERLGMDAVGLSLLDFIQVRDAYSQIIQCSYTKRGTQLTTTIYDADGRVTSCRVVVSIAPCYTQWVLVGFIEKLPSRDRPEASAILGCAEDILSPRRGVVSPDLDRDA